MPTLTAKNPQSVENELLSQSIVGSGATESHIFRVREPSTSPRNQLYPSGSFGPNPHEATFDVDCAFVVWKSNQFGRVWHDYSIEFPAFDTTAIPTDTFLCYVVDSWLLTSASPPHVITTEAFPGFGGESEQKKDRLSPKLRYRLSQFEDECLGQGQESAATLEAAIDLVTWLCDQSDTVSLTVSDDGVLSVATVFPDDVRLYVEIERDGSTGAAVTRQRRYARDITSNDIADLTPEVILAAIGSV